MTIVRSCLNGYHAIRSSLSMVLLVYVTNLLFAAPLALAFHGVWAETLGSSLSAGSLLPGFDFTVIHDLLKHQGDGFLSLLPVAALMTPAYLILNIFLTGGILSTVMRESCSFSVSSFFSACGLYFLRFLRLSLIAGAVLLVMILLLPLFLADLKGALTAGASSETPVVITTVGLGFVFLLALMPIFLINDYARIITITGWERRMLRSAWQSVRFVAGNFIPTAGLLAVFVLAILLLTALYLGLDAVIGVQSWTTVVLMFVLQQGYILLRTWTRIFSFAAAASLFRGVTAEKMPTQPERFLEHLARV